MKVNNVRDFLASLLLMGLALLFGWSALQSNLGALDRVGPGMIPLALAGLILVLGVVLLIGSLGSKGETPSSAGWYSAAIVALSIILFALLIQRLGLFVALPAAVLLASRAVKGMRWKLVMPLAVGITVFSYFVFVVGLNLPLPVVGSWLGG